MSARSAAGFTLVELLVVVALLSIALAMVPASWRRSENDGPLEAFARVRDHSIRMGRSATTAMYIDSVRITARAFPDGRLHGAGPYGIDPLSGRAPDGIGGVR